MGEHSPSDFYSEINSLSVQSEMQSVLLCCSFLLCSGLLYSTVLYCSLLFCTLLCSVYFLAKKCPFLAKK